MLPLAPSLASPQLSDCGGVGAYRPGASSRGISRKVAEGGEERTVRRGASVFGEFEVRGIFFLGGSVMMKCQEHNSQVA